MLKNNFEVHLILYPSKKCVQNSQFLGNWEPSEIYISLLFLYKCETSKAYISLHIDNIYIYVTHMKIRIISGIFIVIGHVGQFDLLKTYYGLPRFW